MKRRFTVLIVIAAMLACSMPVTVLAEGQTASPRGRKVRLLMVDNSKENRRVVKEFRKVGVKVTTAYSLKKADPDKYDGLIIPGGHNIDPRMYGARRSKYTYGTNIKKDRLQIRAIKRFAKAGKPVLGLCRGCQVINVAFGGTITQHIRWHKGYRKVKNVKGYWMYSMYGARKNTYHFHHQCVKKLGKGLIATSYDVKSRHIESIQHESLPVYGIQWHPDVDIKRQGNKMFRRFRKICLQNMAEQKAEADARAGEKGE